MLICLRKYFLLFAIGQGGRSPQNHRAPQQPARGFHRQVYVKEARRRKNLTAEIPLALLGSCITLSTDYQYLFWGICLVQFRMTFRFKFYNEPALDAGGVAREWSVLRNID